MKKAETAAMENSEDYEAQGALEDHLRVAKHRANPKLMKRVRQLAKDKKAHLGKLDLGMDEEDEKPKSIKELKAKAGIEV
jgi:hypothetical protein